MKSSIELQQQRNYGKIVVIRRSGEDSASFDLTETSYTFGRSPSCDIRIQLSSVAEQHCRLVLLNDKIVLENLDAQGTKVNGEPVAANQSVILKGGEVITVVERSFRYEASPWMIQSINAKAIEENEVLGVEVDAGRKTPVQAQSPSQMKVKTPVPQESPSLRRSESPRRILAPEFTVNPADIPLMPVHSPSRDWVVHDGVIGQKSPIKTPSSPSRFTITPTKRLVAAPVTVTEEKDVFADLTPIAVISPKKPKLISGLATPLPPSRLAQSTRFSSPNSPATPMHAMQVDREIVASPRLAMSPTLNADLLIGSPLKELSANEDNGLLVSESVEENILAQTEETGDKDQVENVLVNDGKVDENVLESEVKAEENVLVEEVKAEESVLVEEVGVAENVVENEEKVQENVSAQAVEKLSVEEDKVEVEADEIIAQAETQEEVTVVASMVKETVTEVVKSAEVEEVVCVVAHEEPKETIEANAVEEEGQISALSEDPKPDTVVNEEASSADEEVAANGGLPIYSDARTLELSQGTELALREDVCMAEPQGMELEFGRDDPFAEVCEMAKETLLRVEEMKPAETIQLETATGAEVTLPTETEEPKEQPEEVLAKLEETVETTQVEETAKLEETKEESVDAATAALLEAQQSVSANGDAILTGIIEKAQQEEAEPAEPKEPEQGIQTPQTVSEGSGSQTPRRSTRLATLQSVTKSPAVTKSHAVTKSPAVIAPKSSARSARRKQQEPEPEAEEEVKNEEKEEAEVPAKRSTRSRTPAPAAKKAAVTSERVTRAKTVAPSPPQAKSTGRKATAAPKKKAEVSSSAEDMTSPSNAPARGRSLRTSTAAPLKTAPVQVDKENQEANTVRRSTRNAK